MTFPTHIFKAYDIRGLVVGELSASLAYGIGRAFAETIREKGISVDGRSLVVGYDMRDTSLTYQASVIEGITDAGINVVDIGLVSTPVFNFSCAHFPEYAGGIMVTASHNPAEYNGFKMTLENGLPIGKNNGMDDIRAKVEAGVWKPSERKGSVSTRDTMPDYMGRLYELVNKDTIKPLKTVIDFGNGMGGAIMPAVIAGLPLQTTFLFQEPDGTFPNHEANPLKSETLKDLQAKVKELGADFGFATDGDADRIGLVDENGEIVDPSFVGTLLGLEVLKLHPGGHMLYDLRSSEIIKETWESHGATTEMCSVGHALIKKTMKEKKAIFASELSLHLYYHDLYDIESSDLSFLYIVRLLSESGKKLSELTSPLKKYFHSGEINFEVHDKDGAIARIQEAYKDEIKEVSTIDGIWMKCDWGWINLRKSNTEPVLRLNLEAKTKEVMEREVEKIKGLIGE